MEHERRVVWLRPATHDIGEIHLYLASGFLPAAERVVGAIESTAFSLLTNPLAGRVAGFLGALADVRLSLVRDYRNYLLFYRPTVTGIEVLRVLHGARDLPRLFDGDLP